MITITLVESPRHERDNLCHVYFHKMPNKAFFRECFNKEHFEDDAVNKLLDKYTWEELCQGKSIYIYGAYYSLEVLEDLTIY